MSGPSDKALTAALCGAISEEVDALPAPGFTTNRLLAILQAAHDPALGLDRSVCLRDVVDWLRNHDEFYVQYAEVGDLVEREFAAPSSVPGESDE